MSNIVLMTSEEKAMVIAKKFKALRKKKKITQERLSILSGVSYGSIRRFETSGEISFVSLIDLADAIGDSMWLEGIFDKPRYTSIEEVLNDK